MRLKEEIKLGKHIQSQKNGWLKPMLPNTGNSDEFEGIFISYSTHKVVVFTFVGVL